MSLLQPPQNLLRKLKSLEQHHHVAQVQGLRLFLGIELVKNKKTKEGHTKQEVDALGKVIMEKGVIVRCADSRISLGPPLIVGKDDLDRIFEAIEAGLAELQ